MITKTNYDNFKYVVVTTDGGKLGFNTYKEIAEFFETNSSQIQCLRHGRGTKLSGKIEKIYTQAEYKRLTPVREQRILKRPLVRNQPIKVNMLDRHTNEILMTFNSATDAIEYIGGNSTSGIYRCARGEYLQAFGYKWEIIQEVVPVEFDTTYITTGEIKYVATYKDKEIRFSTLKEMARQLNSTYDIVLRTVQGRTTALSDQGVYIYPVEEYDELEPVREHKLGTPAVIRRVPRRVHMLDRYTNEILDTFASLTEAVEDLGVPNGGSISRACQNGGAAYGYKWEYAD